MSFHEKSAITMLGTIVFVYGWYFLKIFQMTAAGPVETAAVGPLLFGMVVGIVVLGVIAHILIAAKAAIAGEEDVDASDERDKFIEMSANSKSGYVLSVGTLAALALSLLEFSNFMVAHVLLASLVLSEIAKLSLKILAYRKGF
jgi:hypothetical protein